MKKQQSSVGFGKKLSRFDMKKLQGGALAAGTWVCVADFYDCYPTQGQCQTNCSRPSSCRLYANCP